MDLESTKNLLRSKAIIAAVLREHRDDLEITNTSAKTTLQDLLKTAKGIQLNCHARNEYRVGMQLLNCHPPAPQAEEMRAGELARHNAKQRSSAVIESAKGKNTKDSDPLGFLQSLRNELGIKRSAESRTAVPQYEDSANTEAATVSAGDAMDTGEQDPQDTVEAAITKKARTVNISFGMSDSEESDEDE